MAACAGETLYVACEIYLCDFLPDLCFYHTVLNFTVKRGLHEKAHSVKEAGCSPLSLPWLSASGLLPNSTLTGQTTNWSSRSPFPSVLPLFLSLLCLGTPWPSCRTPSALR